MSQQIAHNVKKYYFFKCQISSPWNCQLYSQKNVIFHMDGAIVQLENSTHVKVNPLDPMRLQ